MSKSEIEQIGRENRADAINMAYSILATNFDGSPGAVIFPGAIETQQRLTSELAPTKTTEPFAPKVRSEARMPIGKNIVKLVSGAISRFSHPRR